MELWPAAVDEPEAETDEFGPGTAVAMILVALACTLLVVLPAGIALRAPALPAGWVAVGLGSVVGVTFSLKFVAVVWAAAAHLWSAYPARVVTENAN